MGRVPYQDSHVSIARSQERIRQLFIKYEVQRFGFAEDMEKNAIVIEFQYKGLPVSLPFSSKKMFDAFICNKPWSYRMKRTREQYEKDLREQAKKSIFRFAEVWLKANFEAIEFGLVSFEEVFLAHFVDVKRHKRLIDCIGSRLADFTGGLLQIEHKKHEDKF